MHLKSTNGPIDVLVCPETEETHPGSPCHSHTDVVSYSESTPTPHKMASHSGAISSDENDISLSSIIDTTTDDLDCLLQYSQEYYSLDQDTSALLPTFESLSPPPLHEGDFHFGLDVTEGIGDLFDLS